MTPDLWVVCLSLLCKTRRQSVAEDRYIDPYWSNQNSPLVVPEESSRHLVSAGSILSRGGQLLDRSWHNETNALLSHNIHLLWPTSVWNTWVCTQVRSSLILLLCFLLTLVTLNFWNLKLWIVSGSNCNTEVWLTLWTFCCRKCSIFHHSALNSLVLMDEITVCHSWKLNTGILEIPILLPVKEKSQGRFYAGSWAGAWRIECCTISKGQASRSWTFWSWRFWEPLPRSAQIAAVFSGATCGETLDSQWHVWRNTRGEAISFLFNFVSKKQKQLNTLTFYLRMDGRAPSSSFLSLHQVRLKCHHHRLILLKGLPLFYPDRGWIDCADPALCTAFMSLCLACSFGPPCRELPIDYPES